MEGAPSSSFGDTLMRETGISEPASDTTARQRRRKRIRFSLILPLLVSAMVGLRLYLPVVLGHYVNDLLQRNPLYKGKIDGVEISLWRGAYAVRGIYISKAVGNVPVPLLKADRLELALEWRSLLHGEAVGKIAIHGLELNFVDSAQSTGRQTGSEGAWTGLLADLFPFRINSAEVIGGRLNLRTYDGGVPINVFLSNLNITVADLSNVRKETRPLVASIHASALAMGQSKCECHIQLDPSSYHPTFQLSARMLGLDVTLINSFATHYGAMDFERGWFDFVLETEAKEGLINGYAKALFRDLQILDIKHDFRNGKILEGIWQGVLSVVTFLLTNHDRDQFGTLIPFEGHLTGGTNADLLAVFINILRNAFIQAYLPRFEGRSEEGGFLKFQTPEAYETTNSIPEG